MKYPSADKLDLLPLLPESPALVAHYAGRQGGCSTSPFASLNFGFSTGDDPQAVIANRQRLAVEMAAPLDRWVVAGQVHGCALAKPQWAQGGEGARQPSKLFNAQDAVLLTEPNLFALALSADCPIVVIADHRQRRVGLAHSGWRGTALNIVQVLVSALQDSGSQLEDLQAGVSPAICADCYPVGPEVFDQLSEQPGLYSRWPAAGKGQDKGRGQGLALLPIIREQLLAAGLSTLFFREECSACAVDQEGQYRFFSHRRDAGKSGRGAVLVGFR